MTLTREQRTAIDDAVERAFQDLYERVWERAEIARDALPSDIHKYLLNSYDLYEYKTWWEASGEGEWT